MLPSNGRMGDLLEAYRDGNLQAFDAFFAATKDPLYSYVMHRVKDAQAAQDIIQDSYLRIHRYVASFKRESGKAMPWVFSIVHNCIYDYWSQKKDKSVLMETGMMPDVAARSSLEDGVFLKEFMALLEQQFGKDELDILSKRLISGLSFDEIAVEKGIQADNARQKFSRMLKKIRQLTENF